MRVHAVLGYIARPLHDKTPIVSLRLSAMSFIPNLLTLLRAAAAPVLIVLLEDRAFDLALLLFILAGVSDGLDGYIAKRYHFETRLGAILDPVADKALLVTAFVMLTILGIIPLWLLVTVVFRDVLIVSGYLVLVTLNGNVPMQPSFVSKLNTVMQISLIAVVLAEQARWLDVPNLSSLLIACVFVTTVISGAHYVWVWAFGRQGGIADKPEAQGTD